MAPTTSLLFSLAFIAMLFMACETQHDLSVMTYNIRYDTEKDSLNKWDNRKERVSALIQEHAPDIFGIQEGLVHQVQFLQDALPSYARCGTGRDDGKEKGEFSAVFYNKEVFSVEDCQTFWLSETPDQPGPGWDANLNRVVSWTRLTHQPSGKTLYAFNTHFDHQGEQARRESANLVIQKIKEIAGNDPFVLTGDFNAHPLSVPYQTLSGDSTLMRDTYAIAAKNINGSSGTFATAFHEDNLSEKRIDHIFVSGQFEVLQHEIINTREGSYFPSDHLPVKVLLRF
ncbi:MAG: endonuclease/exonuclease/phosphatase family protein [Cyclobacteriaceae bacterium]|nr:endonuclease/exonuclease/phosphatase family protein [Cyclobacteriaceae bacterium]